MGSVINQDVPNFVVVSGNLASPRGINLEGLKRRDFNREQLNLVKKAYRVLYRTGNRLEQALHELELLNDDLGTLDSLNLFLKNSERGIVR
jgi:UDP-N-acetylglucosamine acyltransferase